MTIVSMRPSAHRRGFTLIELLVVIAIIAILAAILFPVFAKAREKARQTTCMNNQRQIAAAIMMFIQDHDETFPSPASWLTDLSGTYGVAGKVWDCPTSSFKGTEAAPDYFYAGGSLLSNAALGDITQPAEAPMIADLSSPSSNKPFVVHNVTGVDQLTQAAAITDARHNNGANFAFVDGHTVWISKDNIVPFLFAPCVTAASVKAPIDLGEVYKNKTGTSFCARNLGDLAKIISPYGFNRVVGAAGQNSTAMAVGLATSTVIAGASGLPSWLDQTKSLLGEVNNATNRDTSYLLWGGTASTNNVYLLNGNTTSGTTTATLTLVPTITGAKKVCILGENAETQQSTPRPVMTITTVTYYTDATTTTVDTAKSMTMPSACMLNYDGWKDDPSKDQFRAHALYLPLYAGKAMRITVTMTQSAATYHGLWLAMED